MSSDTSLTSLAMGLGGACWVLALSAFNVTVQLSAPRWVVGRALALYQMATFGGMALGSAVWGLLAERFGTADSLDCLRLVHAVGILIGFFLSLPDHKLQNLDPLSRWTEPKVTIDIKPRSGPVVITIEYVIRQEDVRAFLAVMSERRRVRRRDGARHWTLLRDLADPELWVERYHTPTWLDYIRHNQRITQADAEIGERISVPAPGSESSARASHARAANRLTARAVSIGIPGDIPVAKATTGRVRLRARRSRHRSAQRGPSP